jgi:hypothetical protein
VSALRGTYKKFVSGRRSSNRHRDESWRRDEQNYWDRRERHQKQKLSHNSSNKRDSAAEDCPSWVVNAAKLLEIDVRASTRDI